MVMAAMSGAVHVWAHAFFHGHRALGNLLEHTSHQDVCSKAMRLNSLRTTTSNSEQL